MFDQKVPYSVPELYEQTRVVVVVVWVEIKVQDKLNVDEKKSLQLLSSSLRIAIE